MRTEQRVTGDFDLTVAMWTSAPLVPPKVDRGKRCDLGGGLAVWEDDGKTHGAVAKTEKGQAKEVSVCRYYDFHGEPRRGEPREWLRGEVGHSPGRMHQIDDDGDPTETTHLRITRRGCNLTVAMSPDGKAWKELHRAEVDFPAEVSVGVWAYEATNQGYDVIFEKFTLTPVK